MAVKQKKMTIYITIKNPHQRFRKSALPAGGRGLFLLAAMKSLNVDGVILLHTIDNRRLQEFFSGAQFFNNTRFLDFSLELFKSFFDVFAFFNRNDNHNKM